MIQSVLSFVSGVGEWLLGLLIGEFLHRLSLLFEELYHLDEKQYRSSRVTLVSQVFTCRHNQHWKAACLISLAFLLISVKNGQDEQNDCTVSNIFSICIIWSLLRMFGILDNSVDDLDIFRENNAELGPGIATNYWFGFLKILLQSSEDNHIRTKIENYCYKNTYTNHETYGKIILFLQNDCNFSHDSKKMESEQIYKCLPESQACLQGTCNHDIEFRSGVQRKTMTVYWIYKDKENQDPSSPRIFFLYDPVTNLRTAMGPETVEPANQRPVSKSREQSQPIRGTEWSDRGRRRNIQSFRETLDRLSGNMNRSFVYLEFNALTDTTWRPSLSELVRDKIMENHFEIDSGMSSDEN